MKLMYLMTSNGVSVVDPLTSETVNVSSDSPMIENVLEYIQLQDSTIEGLKDLLDVKKSLSYKDDNISVEFDDSGDFVIVINGKKVDNVPCSIKKRIMTTIRENKAGAALNLSLFGKFLSKLYKNPSFKVVQQLYGFMNANTIPITSDGTFLAYKKVGWDYKDLYSHTFDNSIGKVCTMERNAVEDDPNKTCSVGLHVCSFDYLAHYGSCDKLVNRIIICEVDPEDVVSVPVDYDNAKMRVSKYKVVDELTDFSQQLRSWYVGKHKDGWIHDTLITIEKFYRKFWKLAPESRDFNWDRIENRAEITSGLQLKFEKELKATFSEIPFEHEMICVDEGLMLRPLELFTVLSQYDEDALLESKQECSCRPKNPCTQYCTTEKRGQRWAHLSKDDDWDEDEFFDDEEDEDEEDLD